MIDDIEEQDILIELTELLVYLGTLRIKALKIEGLLLPYEQQVMIQGPHPIRQEIGLIFDLLGALNNTIINTKRKLEFYKQEEEST